MRDVVVLTVTGAFFAVCVAYVRWCDHIIGTDPDVVDDALAPSDLAQDATSATPDAAEVRS